MYSNYVVSKTIANNKENNISYLPAMTGKFTQCSKSD